LASSTFVSWNQIEGWIRCLNAFGVSGRADRRSDARIDRSRGPARQLLVDDRPGERPEWGRRGRAGCARAVRAARSLSPGLGRGARPPGRVS